MAAKAKTLLRNTGAFFKYYFKRHGVTAGILSFVCFALFYGAIIPANAILPSGTYEFDVKDVGGVYAESSDNIYSVQNPIVPRNAAGERLIYAGNYKVTHYCACTICTWGSGVTASGKKVAEGMIAADWKVLPKGTKVYIKRGDNFIEKVVEDRGGAIQGNKIDVYVPSHGDALARGVYYADLYVDPETELP